MPLHGRFAKVFAATSLGPIATTEPGTFELLRASMTSTAQGMYLLRVICSRSGLMPGEP